MRREPLRTTLQSARRLAVATQQLAGKLPSKATRGSILALVRDLAFVQWDPVSIVAPSHRISLWSRLGDFRPSDLERLLWDERKLFLHWTPIASIVRTEDFPLFHSLMRRYPQSLSRSWGHQRTAAGRFLVRHAGLRRRVLNELRKGPRTAKEFDDPVRTKRRRAGWDFGSDLSLMLFHLLMRGEVMVVGHRGNQNVWGLARRFLPEWVDRTVLSEAACERGLAERAIRALGTATPKEISFYFPRGRYQALGATLARLHRDSTIERVRVEGMSATDERYVHAEHVPLLESLGTGDWEPRLSLLPPFDNLVGDTARLDRLFGFHYIREQFLPAEKRRFGTYVLPILWGDRFIGRIDPRLDKASGNLVINAVHAEPHAPGGREIAATIEETIARFAAFLGADRVTYPSRVPEEWKSSLR